MRILIYLLLLHAIILPARAQQVGLLTVDELEQRFSAGGDTTYVVNFWATWCLPCVQELPHFEKFGKAYRDEPVKVLLVSVDSRTKLNSAVTPFVKKKGLQNEVVLLNETNQQQYIDRISPDWSGSLPATLFVNKGKKVRQLREKEFTYNELETTYRSLK
jgi:thiol-disulfide isomerase/thioredoxin